MDISRRGAERDHGRTDIISGLTFTSGNESSWKDNVRWNHHEKALMIEAKRVLHTDGRSRHNYKIKLTLEDVAALIELLGHAGAKTDAKLLRDQLNAKIPAIVKLLACATGVQPLEIPEDTEDQPAGRPRVAKKATKKVGAPKKGL